jgi:AraC-like DNA-binding protein
LLAAGELSLPEIAHAAGFSSVSTFCRSFRRETGATPAATWRALHRRPMARQPAR